MKLLRLVPAGIRLPFMRYHRIAVALSAALLVASAALLFANGLNFGIDFKGGTIIEIETPDAPDLGTLRTDLNGLGVGDISLQEFGAENDILIRLPLLDGEEEAQQAAVDTVQSRLSELFPEIDYRRVEFVGPQVSGELIGEPRLMAIPTAPRLGWPTGWLTGCCSARSCWQRTVSGC